MHHNLLERHRKSKSMKSTLTALVLASLVLAGCVTDAPGAGETGAGTDAPRWSTQEWRDALTEDIYTDVTTDIVRIDAADGTGLTMTVHLPAGFTEGTTFPTLQQITPYQSGRLSTPATPDAPPGGAWMNVVRSGVAYVEADARGTNGSEGCLDFGGSADRSDAQVFHEWIVNQPWSNGRVVTDGVSHPGMGSVVAHAAVPELTAALAHAPVVSYYQDQWVLGARLEQINEFYQTVESQPAMYADAESAMAQAAACTGETLLDFGQIDGPWTEKWEDRHLARHILPEVTAPILLTHGFVDMNVHPDHSQMYWDALPDDFPKYAIFGWWYHSWPDMTGHPAEQFADWRHRWMDATLHGVDNGLWSEPRVLVEDSTGVWHESHDWPIDGSEQVTLLAGPTGTLGSEASEGWRRYSDTPGAQRGSWVDANVTFRSDPLAQDMLVNGEPRVHLVATSTSTQTKWVVYLLDEAPDGSWQRIAQGYADSRVHGGEGTWEDSQPGKEYSWEIPLLPTAKVVPKGHQIVLLVASEDASTADPRAPCWEAHRGEDGQGGCYSPTGIVRAINTRPATNAIQTGPDATSVTFAWVDPATTNKPPEAPATDS